MDEFAERVLSPTPGSTMPPSSITALDDPLIIPERAFFDQLEDRARRAELLAALLQAKGLSPESGVRALQASLGAVEASAEAAHLPSLAALARALQGALGHLGLTSEERRAERSLDVLVLDESEVSRDLVALAVEGQGHLVRCAGAYSEFIGHLDERLPDLIVAEIELSNAPARQFAEGLVELLSTRPVPFVFFSAVPAATLHELSTKSHARAAVSKDEGIAGLMAALQRVFPLL